MTQITSIITYLDTLLAPEEYKDTSLNGLQVEAFRGAPKKIAFAVDCGESIIDQAISHEANLLVVHHGLLWGALETLTGIVGQKFSKLYKNQLSLYASHLPLDGHREVGNAAQLCFALGLETVEPAFPFQGTCIGSTARTVNPVTAQYFIERSRTFVGASTPLLLPFGKSQIRTVGVVTGSGSFAIEAAAKSGLDLLISGEPKQSAYHEAKENKLNVLFLGHYATETFGVRALETRIKKDFKLETIFIDEPTGI